jgi:ABC-2 type transport system ATP-binding protein
VSGLILRADGIRKKYGAKLALENFSIDACGGQIIGLLGPNGSGKTTFLKLTAGLVKPTAGSIVLLGLSPGPRARARVSFMSTEEYLYAAMRIQDVIKFYSDMFADFDQKKCLDYLQFFYLTPDMKVRNLSTGMRAGLKMVLAFSRRAAVILLDEPLNGIDVVARDLVIDLIKKEKRDDCVVFVTSHLVDELEEIIDYAVFLARGVTVLSGRARELLAERGCSLNDLYREVYRGKID